ncbi:MAG: GntR family transcriptional regulator [Anaerolineales bacterium]|nr:GntR family transcriptional regulator [Anaerolineales bacterium]
MPENRDENSLKVQTIQENVVDRIRDLILTRHLRPGERIVQSELAEQLGVSRTPIREALYELASDGLVVLSRHKGASVADFSLDDLIDIYSIRIPLEGQGAYLATQNMDSDGLGKLQALFEQMKDLFQRGDRWRLLSVNRQFYAEFFAYARRRRLYELIMKHLDMASLYRRLAFTLEDLYDNTIAEHEKLLEVIKRGDAEEVRRLSSAGLEDTVSKLIEFLQ